MGAGGSVVGGCGGVFRDEGDVRFDDGVDRTRGKVGAVFGKGVQGAGDRFGFNARGHEIGRWEGESSDGEEEGGEEEGEACGDWKGIHLCV